MNRLIVITGPTGVGKSDVAVEVARFFKTHVLSADSRQIYKGMAIGTAQPTAEQLAAAPHHFVASHGVEEHFTCARWATEAEELLRELFQSRNYVVAAGGSGLYVDALCRGLDPMPDHDPALRERLSAMPLPELLELLHEHDPAFFDEVDRQNPRRVLRAVEMCLQTGRPYSGFRQGAVASRDFEVVKIALDLPRAELYARIDRRVEAMMAAGLEAEARALLPWRTLNALQTVGYRELFDYFDGSLTLAEAVELIKRNSRRYAKRQLTWLRRDPAVEWFAPTDLEKIITFVKK